MPNSRKVEPHWEIVRSDAPYLDQAWHARRVAGGQIVWTTEQYARKVAAERAIIAWITDTLEATRFETVKVTLESDRIKGEKAIYVNGVLLPRRVLYVDERAS